jgi:nucleotide-binding universal stress UspA family protein
MSTAIRLLVAIDGSKSTERTLQALATQFSSTSTTVRVLNVVEPITVAVSPQMAAGYAPELEARLKDARASVEQAANTLAGC